MANIPSKKCKTLTEQWRDGTLLMGYYYVSKLPSYGGEAIEYLDDDCSFGLGEDIIQEVLAPVPYYEKVKEMSQKIERLEFDNGALEISRDELEKKLNKAEDAIKEAYWKCENCYKGVCQYCLNSGVRCYMQGNKVESVGKIKKKLDIALKALEEVVAASDDYRFCQSVGYKNLAHKALKQIEEVK